MQTHHTTSQPAIQDQLATTADALTYIESQQDPDNPCSIWSPVGEIFQRCAACREAKLAFFFRLLTCDGKRHFHCDNCVVSVRSIDVLEVA